MRSAEVLLFLSHLGLKRQVPNQKGDQRIRAWNNEKHRKIAESKARKIGLREYRNNPASIKGVEFFASISIRQDVFI